MRRLATILATLIVLASSCVLWAQEIDYPSIQKPNVFLNTNQFTSGLFTGPVTFSALTNLVGLTNFVYVSDATPGTTPCAGSGTGAFAFRIGSQWSCSSSSTSNPVTNPSVSAVIAPLSIVVYATPVNGGVAVVGDPTAPGIFGSSQSTVLPSNTSCGAGGASAVSSASSSTSTVAGVEQGAGANFGPYSFNINRWGTCFQPNTTSNVRYWLGLTVFNTGGSGCETVVTHGTTCFASDTPNRSFIGFRYSSTTDSGNWACVAQTTGGSQTVASTGVAVDTSAPHRFEFTYDGTNLRCFIDGTLDATVSTNAPPAGTPRVIQFWSTDNKNTNTAVGGTFFWSDLVEK